MGSRYKSLALGRSAHGYGDTNVPPSMQDVLDQQKLEYQRLDWQARQAAQRGLISDEDYKASRLTGHANGIQKYLMLGLGTKDKATTGSTLETIGDVLSLGGYASAAVAQGAIKGSHTEVNLDPTGLSSLADWATNGKFSEYVPHSLSIGFSPSAAYDAWLHRTTYEKIAQENDLFGSDRANFWGGLAGDILLDPTTYLTFGLSKGAKVGLQSLTREAVPSLAKLGERVTLTRTGTTLFRHAAKMLTPQLTAEMAARGEKVGGALLDGPIAQEWMDRIADFTVSHFDQVKASYLEQATKGWWNNAAKVLAPAGETARAQILKSMGGRAQKIAGLGVKDLFEETSSVLTKDRGLFKTQQVQRALAKVPGFKSIFNTFDRGWNLAPELLEKSRLAEVAKEAAYRQTAVHVTKALSELTDDELNMVTHAIEARGKLADWGETGFGGIARYDDHIEKAIKFVQDEFSSILAEEKGRGFSTQTVKGYITHIRNPEVRKWYEQALKKGGVETFDGTNRFAEQRAIASIAEGEDLYGKGALLTNARDILIMRKKASIRMLQDEELFEDIVKHYSVPEAIVTDVARGMSKGIPRGWFRRWGTGIHEILTVDQVYQAEHGNLSKLGFRDPDPLVQDIETTIKVDDAADAALKHNIDVLSYLHRPNDQTPIGKFSVAGEAEATRLNLPEAARLHYVEFGTKDVKVARPIPEDVVVAPVSVKEFDIRLGKGSGGRLSIKGAASKEKATDILGMFLDPSHPGWNRILRARVDGKEVPVFDQLRGLLGGMNNYTVRWLDSQITGMIPDLDARVLEALDVNGLLGDMTKEEAGEAVQKITSRFTSSSLEIRRVKPMLSPTFVELARATRRAAGIRTHETPLTPQHLAEARGLLAEFGFTDSVAKQLFRALFDGDELKTLHDYDLLEQTLRPLRSEKNLREGKFIPSRFDDDTIVPYTIELTRKQEGNLLPEKFDEDLGIPTASATVVKGSRTQTNILRESEQAVAAGQVPPPGMRLADAFQPDRQELASYKHGEVAETTRVPGTRPPSHPLANRIDVATRNEASARKALEDHQAEFQKLLGDRPESSVANAEIDAKVAREKVKEVNKALRKARADLRVARGKAPAKVLTKEERKAKALLRKPPKDKSEEALQAMYDKGLTEEPVKPVKEAKEPGPRAPRPKYSKEQRAKIDVLKAVVEGIKKEKDKASEALDLAEKARLTPQQMEKLQELRSTRKALRTDLKEKAKHVNELRAEERAAEVSRAKASMTGGINIPPGQQVAQDATLSDRIRHLRNLQQQELEAAAREGRPPSESLLQGLNDRLKALSPTGERPMTQAGAAAEVARVELPHGPGELRPSTKPVKLQVYIPQNVKDFLDDLSAPNLPPELSGFAKKAIRTLDRIQSFYKVHRLLPFGAYWTRNAMQAALANVMEHGLGYISPASDAGLLKEGVVQPFGRGQASMASLLYALGRGSDFKISRAAVEKYGRLEVRAIDGSVKTIEQLYHDMLMRGILHGAVSAEAHGVDNLWSKAARTLSGAAVGMAYGGVVGGLTGTEGGLDWGSALGAMVGGAAGLGVLRKVGVPLKVANGAEYLVKSNYAPLARVGEAASELPFRTAMYIQSWIKTGSAAEAAQKVYTHMSDYHNLSVFERRWLRRLIPFYAWTKTAFKSTIHTAVEEPGRLGMVFKAFRDWNVAHDADAEDIPDFMHGKFTAVVNGADAEQERYLWAPQITAVEDVSQVLSGLNLVGGGDWQKESGEFIKEVGGRSSFLPAAAAEFLLNRDFFSGKKIVGNATESDFSDGQKFDTMPSWLKPLVGYQAGIKGKSESSVSPRMAWMLGKIPFSRLVDLTTQVQEMDERGKRQVSTRALAQTFLAASTLKVDPEKQKYYVNKGRIEALKRLLDHVIVQSLPEPPKSAKPTQHRYLRR